MKLLHIGFLLLVVTFCSISPKPALGQDNLEQRVSHLEHRAISDEGVGLAAFVCAALLALWAQNTGRNAWLWFFLGLFFSVIVIFVMLYKNSNDRKTGGSR
jgi:hypothetical protein